MSGIRDIVLPDGRILPARLLELRVSRSSGPGGQNVNKVSSKVDLRLNLEGAIDVLGADDIDRVREKYATRLDGEGCLQVVCSEYREQGRNLETALERVARLIQLALVRPKRRVPTSPSLGVTTRRLNEKKRRGQVKRLRTSTPTHDE